MFFSVQYAYASHRSPYAIRSGGERNLIGWRTQSDWVANGIRLDGERERWQNERNHSTKQGTVVSVSL